MLRNALIEKEMGEKERGHCIFFGGGRGSNPRPCIYYALSIPTELSSKGQRSLYFTTVILCYLI